MDVILGTAGHIDHGKTTLVRALTGIDCDRLEEEKRRGITIELGFAWLDLADGRRIGIVDVPGHERFIKNMVAGAAGIDCVLLVIAADGGVMPQTREHLEICSLLGVGAGVVAITKSDLVDPEWLNFMREDIKTSLAGTFLENAEIIPVSTSTGEGLEALRAALARLTKAIPTRRRSDILRLPIDRVFSMKGFGTVVTGTIVSGACSQSEKLCLAPSGKLTIARNLQVHNLPVKTARSGQRCAINLQGLDVAEVQRGDIVARPGTLFPAQSWFIRLNCVKSSPLPIRQRMEAHFHHGSRDCLAKIVFQDRNLLEPGQSAIAEVKFTEPLPAVYGDHCVLRAHSPLKVIGGGIVINPLPPPMKKRDPDYARKMAALKELGETDKTRPHLLASKSPKELIKLALALCPTPGTDASHLQILTGLARKDLDAALAQNDDAFCWDSANDCWIGKEYLQKCLEKYRLRAEELHAKEPLKSFFAPGALLEGWGEKFPQKFAQALQELAISQGIIEAKGAGLKLAQHRINFSKDDAKILATMLEQIKSGGATPPFIREIAEKYAWEPKRLVPLLNYLCDSDQLLKIQEGIYYTKEEFANITDKILAWFSTHDAMDIGNIKEILGVSRKYALPILDYLDSIHITYRVNNYRRLYKK